jgi:hypothetical protein
MTENIKLDKIPEDRFEALKEAQKVSGLNQSDFDLFLKILSKSAEASVVFGNPELSSIAFSASALLLRVTFAENLGSVEKT